MVKEEASLEQKWERRVYGVEGGEGHRDVNEKGKPRAKECKVKVFGYAYEAPT